MDPIIPFIKMYKEHIIGVTSFANCTDNNKEVSIEEIQDIEIQDDYVYFVGKKEVLGIPIDGAIVDFDEEFNIGENNNLITVFNKKFGYIKTKKFDF